MEGEWNEVKAKPKRKKPQNQQPQVQFGGKGKGGTLKAGPIQQQEPAQYVNSMSGGF